MATRSKLVGGILQFVCFTETGRHSLSDVKPEQHFTGVAQRQRAGLITLSSSDRNGSPVLLHFGGFAEATSLLRQTLNTVTVYRHGAEAARRAHNPEVTGSKPVAGILHFGGFAEATSLLRQTLNTVM